MENVLMCLCRNMHGYGKTQIADTLDITTDEYEELETSAAAMMPEQAEKLAAMFNIDAEYFLESSRQLELLLTRGVIIENLQSELERLRQFIFARKDVLLENSAGNETAAKDKSACHEQEATRQ